MWNVEDDLLKIGGETCLKCKGTKMGPSKDEYGRPIVDGSYGCPACGGTGLTSGTKDVCCNTAAYFSIRATDHEVITVQEVGNPNPIELEGRSTNLVLDMTVTNRSNDLIWGMLGANVVHFSFLQEYIACALGIGVGTYNQFTNNLHVYLSNWKPKQWLKSVTDDRNIYRSNRNVQGAEHIPLVRDKATFDQEVSTLVNSCYDTGDGKGFRSCSFTEPFLKRVAVKMCMAYLCYKRGDYKEALRFIARVEAADWRIAGREWIARRLEKKGIEVGS
jgi:hypothetical protein